MMRALVVIMLLIGCGPAMLSRDSELEPEVFPLDEYEPWDGWEQNRDILAANGYGRVFKELVGLNVTEWWVALVEPGTYTNPLLVVRTDEGEFTSDRFVFASAGGQTLPPYDPPVTVDLEGFERYSLDGEVYVVAFVHFPNPPKGQLIKWEVSP